MAKAKKTAALTLEERLEQALVPEAEHPYPVPENWCWVNLPSACKYIRAGGDKPACFSEEKTGLTAIPVVANGISNEGIVGYTDIANEKENTITISGRGTIGFSVLRKYPYYPIIRLIVICPKENINSLYIKYIFDHFLESGAGSSIPQLTVPMLKNKGIPIPPLAEQQRIVDRIESLFAKLDEAKEKAQAALDSFEIRKAAILHKAFSGELTAKWRKENGVRFESWVEKSLGTCGTLERGRSRHRPRNASELFGGPYPFIQTGDVASSEVYVTRHKQTLSKIGLEQSKIFPKGTLCITIAANIGEIAILSYDSCFPDSVVGFTPNYCTDSKYIYYIMSVLQKKLEAEAPATAQKNINLKILNDVTFLCPDLSEQTEIVRILDDFFAKEQKAKELCSVLDNIDLIKKSILARAFRGELGTNNPTEESAVELLKSIV